MIIKATFHAAPPAAHGLDRPRCGGAKSGPPAWKTLPSWYMVATDDQMIPPQAEEFTAKRMAAEVRKVASSHAAMVSHPKEVADLITLAANAVASV